MIPGRSSDRGARDLERNRAGAAPSQGAITVTMLDELYPAARVAASAEAARRAGLDALLLTPGPDLRYVVGYDAHALERLTCLTIPSSGDPFLVVPRLELPAAQASARPPRPGDDSVGRDRRPLRAGGWPAARAQSVSLTGCGP